MSLSLSLFLSLISSQKKYPFNFDAADDKDLPALHSAVLHQVADVIPHLLDAGATTKTLVTSSKLRPHKDMRGVTMKDISPLHFACLFASAKVVVALIEGKAPLHQTAGSYKSTPLHIAATFNNIGPVRELLRAGANPNMEDEMGDNCLHAAAMHAANDVVAPLIRGGADLWKPNKSGKSIGTLIGSSEVPLSTQLAIIEATGALDHREFLLKKDHPNAKAFHFDGVLKDKWAECPQYGITLAADGDGEAEVFVMVHQPHDHTKDNQMKKIGFMVLTSEQARFRLPTYKANLVDYGKTEAFAIRVKKGEHFVISPYTKLPEGAGSFNFIALSDGPVEVSLSLFPSTTSLHLSQLRSLSYPRSVNCSIGSTNCRCVGSGRTRPQAAVSSLRRSGRRTPCLSSHSPTPRSRSKCL